MRSKTLERSPKTKQAAGESESSYFSPILPKGNASGDSPFYGFASGGVEGLASGGPRHKNLSKGNDDLSAA
jgi:hypothetical protein